MRLRRLAPLLLAALAGCGTPPEEKLSFNDFRAVETQDYPPGAVPDLAKARPEAGLPYPPRTDLPKLDENSTLADYLLYARMNNPGVEAAFREWQAALYRAPQERTLPDPRGGYGIFLPDIQGRLPDRRQGFDFAQELPWFGKLPLRGEIALHEAHAAKQRYEAAKLKVYYAVKNPYAELCYLGRAIEIQKEIIESMKQTERLARARYVVSAGAYGDVVRAEIEISKMENELRSLTNMRDPQTARLNVALGRTAKAAIASSGTLPDPTTSANIDDAQLFAWLREANPELKALGYDITRADKAVLLAGKQFYPDPMIDLNYMDMRGGLADEFMVQVSANLPIWREKYRAGEEEARARLRTAVRMRQDRQNMLESEIEMALFGLYDARRRMTLYHDRLLPQAEEVLRSLAAAYATGNGMFLDLLEAQRGLLDFHLQYERARADAVQRVAEIEMIVGRTLDGGPTNPADRPPDAARVQESQSETTTARTEERDDE
jgi:outer membrane protein, heavy metal efflux system